MDSRTALAAALLVCGLSGCGRDHTLACEATARYANAASAQPVRIPDDLSPPDETDSLRLPLAATDAAAPIRPCLETPPGFFAEGAPGGTRLGNAPVRATPPPPVTTPPGLPTPASPAPASEGAAADDPDRRIGN
jgi:hypothetical protein